MSETRDLDNQTLMKFHRDDLDEYRRKPMEMIFKGHLIAPPTEVEDWLIGDLKSWSHPVTKDGKVVKYQGNNEWIASLYLGKLSRSSSRVTLILNENKTFIYIDEEGKRRVGKIQFENVLRIKIGRFYYDTQDGKKIKGCRVIGESKRTYFDDYLLHLWKGLCNEFGGEIHDMNVRKSKDSGHYAYPTDKRKEIADEFRNDKRDGLVTNMNSWAKLNYDISGRTLRSYLNENPEM